MNWAHRLTSNFHFATHRISNHEVGVTALDIVFDDRAACVERGEPFGLVSGRKTWREEQNKRKGPSALVSPGCDKAYKK